MTRHLDFNRLMDHADVRELRVGLTVTHATFGRSEERRRNLEAITVGNSTSARAHTFRITRDLDDTAQRALEAFR